MNVEECARLVALVRTLYPAQRFDENPENVVNGWGFVVADVDFGEAHEAVIQLARRGSTWVAPGDVRREVAKTRHVLSPDVDELIVDMREVASRDGLGRSELHPAAQAAYASIGGASQIRRMDARALMQMRRIVEEQIAKHDSRVLESRMPPPAAGWTPIAQRITENAARQLEAAPLPPRTRDVTERVDVLREWAEKGTQS